MQPLRSGEHLIQFDKLVAVSEKNHGTAIKAIGGTNEIFDSHFPNFSVLPGVLLVSTLVKLSETVEFHNSTTPNTLQRLELLEMHGIQCRRFVQPGDVVTLSVKSIGTLQYQGEAFVDNKLVLKVRSIIFEKVKSYD